MTDSASTTDRPTLASIQAEIDARIFEQSPLHIIERYLDSFAEDGGMAFEVPQHILEALALRFRAFLAPGSALTSLDEAFGGKIARQRQARRAAEQQYEVAFLVFVERQRLRKLKPSERRPGTPHELACEAVAQQLNMSVDNVRRLYKESKTEVRATPG